MPGVLYGFFVIYQRNPGFLKVNLGFGEIYEVDQLNFGYSLSTIFLIKKAIVQIGLTA